MIEGIQLHMKTAKGTGKKLTVCGVTEGHEKEAA